MKSYFFTYKLNVNAHITNGSGVVESSDSPVNIFQSLTQGLHKKLEDKKGDKQVIITNFKLII